MAANIIGRLFRSYRCSPAAVGASSSQMVRCYGSRSTSQPRFVTDHLEPMRIYTPPEDKGRDGNHWLIATKDLDGDRDQMVATYIDLVASVLGSVEEAKKRMYSVSTKYYFAVGLKAPKDLALLFMKHPDVEQVIEDSYVNCATKDYGGEPIIDGQVEPYHPRHHDLYHRGQEEFRQGKVSGRSSRNRTLMLRMCILTLPVFRFYFCISITLSIMCFAGAGVDPKDVARPAQPDDMIINRSLDQADMLKMYGAEPTFSEVMASRWKLLEMVVRPPNNKLIRPTCHLERPKDDDIDNIYHYKGVRMFEVVLHSCRRPFWWGIHGGRTRYKTSIYVPRLGRHVQTLINCYAKSRFEKYYQETKRSQIYRI